MSHVRSFLFSATIDAMNSSNAPVRVKSQRRNTPNARNDASAAEKGRVSQQKAAVQTHAEGMGALYLIGRLAAMNVSPEDVVHAALDSLVSLVPVDDAMLWQRQGRRLILTGERRSTSGPKSDSPAARPCDKCWGRVAVREKRAVFARSGRASARPRNGCVKEGVRSCAAMPLLSANQLLGVLTLTSTRPGLFVRREGFMEGLAGQVSITLQNALLHQQVRRQAVELEHQAMERVRAEQAQQASEAQFRALVENSWNIFVTLNADGVILYASPSIHRFGYELDQLIGRNFVEFVDPAQAETVTRRAAELLQQPGQTSMFQARVRRADGAFTWIEAIATNVLHDGDMAAIVLDCRDVTERTHVEEELRQYANEQATLYKISLRLNSESTLPGLLQTIVELGVGLVHAEAGAIFRFDPELNVLRLDAGVGFEVEYAGWMSEPSQGVEGKVWQKRLPLVVDDYAHWEGRAIPFAYDARIKAVLAVPLLGPRGPLGVLVVNSSAPERKFSERDVRLLEMLSAQASLTIENALFFQQEHHHRELAETLREVGAALTATLDPQLVLDNILAQVGRLVPHDAANIMHIEDGVARIVRWRGYESFGNGDLREYSAELEENSLWRAMDTSGKPIVLADTREEPNWDASPEMGWVRSFLGAPIRVRNQTIGFLNVNSQATNFFTPEHAVRLQALANQAAIALSNAELFEKARVAAERLQALSHRLVQTQEMERARIARELHDEMGQALTAQMVDLHFCEQHVQEPEVVAERLAVLKRSTDSVLENLHRLTVDLRPVALDHLGLVAALRQYVQAFCQQHPEIQVQFQVMGMGDERQPTETETALYRITQESLTNVARHAHATRVEVMIARRGEQIILMCWDNGAGFDPRGVGPNERMGLTSMRERASMLGGFVWIDSELGVGTTVHVEVPYVDSNSDRR